jgi:MFS transporter, AAHS family, 4-hydroxybenzoate transporter
MQSGQRLVDVTSTIDRSQLTVFHYTVFLLCGSVALMDGYDSVAIGVTGASIATSLALDVKTFGPVFSAAQFGFMAGAFFAGPIADKAGRKGVLVSATVLFGVFSLLTILSHGFEALVTYRVVTGVGLGGAATCFVSLASEYAPKRVRGTVVAILWTLVPAGNVVGGLLASILMPRAGWESVYLIGGLTPLVAAALIYMLVPESVSFLVASRAAPCKVAKILSRISGTAVASASTYVTSEEKFSGLAFTYLFSRSYLATTICTWLAFFCTWLILLTTLAWISPLVQQAGLTAASAALIISANSTGGVIGALIVSWMIDKADRHYVNAGALLLGAIAVASVALVRGSFALFAGVLFFAGFFTGGAASGLTAMVAISYPTALRSTGIGWAIAVARLGSAVGPLAAGIIISKGGARAGVFEALGLCGLAAAVAIMILRGVNARAQPVVQDPAGR